MGKLIQKESDTRDLTKQEIVSLLLRDFGMELEKSHSKKMQQ